MDYELPDTITPTMQDQLRWVADALIPADDALGMPSATQAGLIEHLLPRALRSRPDLVGVLQAACEQLPVERPDAALEAVAGLESGLFAAVSHIIAGSYFLDAEVNRKLRYPGQQALRDEPDFDELEEAITRVMERGPVYIPTPTK